MKLAKQIIMLSAVALLAMGLSFVLISGIVVGSQSSLGNELKQLEITYKQNVKTINDTYNATVAYHDALIARATSATVGVETPAGKTVGTDHFVDQAAKDTKIADLTKDKNNLLNGVKTMSPGAAITWNNTTTVPTASVTPTTTGIYYGLTEIKDEALKVRGESYKTAKAKLQEDNKELLKDSFVTYKQKSAFELAVGPVGTVSTQTVLTPMGALMVTGLAFTLIGSALVVTVIIMNKSGGKKAK